MKLTQLDEVRYSHSGRVFEEYWVLYLPTGGEGFAYFNEHGVQTNEFPKRSGRFDSKEKALVRLTKWKKNVNVKIKRITDFKETPLPRAPRRRGAGALVGQAYWDARRNHTEHQKVLAGQKDRRLEDLIDQLEVIKQVVVTKVTVQAEK